MRNIRAEHATDVYLTGEVSGKEVPMLLDSRTSITIVTESLFTVDQLCDSSTTVKGFKSEPIVLPMANIPIKLGEMKWSERVAVVSVEEPEDERVSYAFNLKSERGLKLVLLANDIEVNNVLAVQTRAMVREEREQEEHDRAVVAVEQPTVEPVSEREGVESGREEESELTLGRQEEESELRDLVIELNSSAEGDEEVLFELRAGWERPGGITPS